MTQSKADFLSYIEHEKKYSDKTVTAYRKDLEDFEAFAKETLGDQYLVKADRPFFRKWLFSLSKDGFAKTTIQRKISAVKSFFRFLNERQNLANTSYEFLIAPKQDKNLPDFLTREQVLTIIESVDDDSFEGIRDRAILELFYSTGIRLRELISIKIGDFNFHRGTLKVTGKGSKDRIVPVGSTALKAIQKYQKLQMTKLLENSIDYNRNVLFITKKGKPLYPMAVQRMVKKQLLEHTGINKYNPHIFRHSFATHMLDNGADIRAVKDILGHESLATTQHYTHLSVQKLKQAYESAHPRAESDGH
jgi:integrase/recombinase XerC